MDIKPNTSSLSKTLSFFFGEIVDVDICSARQAHTRERFEKNNKSLGEERSHGRKEGNKTRFH